MKTEKLFKKPEGMFIKANKIIFFFIQVKTIQAIFFIFIIYNYITMNSHSFFGKNNKKLK